MRKYLFSFLIISLALSFFSPSYSQGKQDTLFWFVGHWNNKTTFLVDSNLLTGAKGGTITITAGKKIQISTGDLDKYNKKIDSTAKVIEKDADNIPARIDKEEGVSQATLSKKVQEELEKLHKEEVKLKIKDLETGGSVPADCIPIEAAYNHLLSFYNAHAQEKTFNLPPPPEADYLNCWSCDKQKQIDFDKQVIAYEEAFAKEEKNYASSCLQIMKALGVDFYTGGGATKTCAVDGGKLVTILSWLSARQGMMAKQLLKTYRKNYKTVIPVAKVCILTDKALHLLTEGESGLLSDVGSLTGMVADTMMKQLKKQKDYSMLSEVPLMFYFAKLTGALTGNPDEAYLDKLIYEVGRFTLTVEMDIKMGKDGGYVIAHLKGKSDMIYELDSVDCLHIVPDWKSTHITNIANWNSVSMKVISLEMILPKGTPPKYIGTNIYSSPFPKLKLNFCRQGADSIYLQTFNPDPGDKGTWLFVIPNAPSQKVPSGLMGADRMFMDINDLRNEADQIKPPPAMDEATLKEIQRLSDDIQKNGVTAAKMKKIQELTEGAMKKTQELTLPISNFKFLVNLQNKNKVLISQKFDAKQINPNIAEDIVYGHFTITLEER